MISDNDELIKYGYVNRKLANTVLKNRTVEYSVVVPVYNGADTLEPLFERIKSVFNSIDKSFEVLFVEDCGKDNSWQVIQNLKKKYPNYITAIKLSKNFGQHKALICGFNFVQGNYVITIDDDLQTPPEEIIKLITGYDKTKADVVYGIYVRKKHSTIRNVGSFVVKRVFKFGTDTHKNGSSFRLVTRNVIDQLAQHRHKFIFIDNVLQWYTNSITLVAVNHLSRQNGISGYSFISLVLLTLNLVLNYTAIPLRIMTYGGLFSSLVSFLIGMYFIYKKIFQGMVIGWTSIIVAISFTSSIILFCLGIIGEYIRRIYIEQSEMPQFVIREIQ